MKNWSTVLVTKMVGYDDMGYDDMSSPGLLNSKASSGNFLGAGEVNSKAYYLWRSSAEDPWINLGNNHAVGNNYMFWGETHEDGSEGHLTF